MTTVIIDTRSVEAQKILEFLKTTRYAKVLEEKTPNNETLKAMEEVEAGHAKSYKSVKELMTSLKKSAGV
ncbi:MAG TPA: hypothetical protein VFC92_07905 [Bacteroidales bacterium]|nr:hypothetical protein [Bacteroidales bacterium]